MMHRNPWHFCLLPSTVVLVRHLNIQRKLRKHHRGGERRVWLLSNSININKNNFISVVTLAFHDGLTAFDSRNWKWINMGMLNARSIKNKDLAVKELITEYNLDIVLITETGLRQEDDILKKSTCLTLEKWEIHCVDRKTGHKGVDWHYYIIRIRLFS